MATTTTLRLSTEAYATLVQSVCQDDHEFEEQCTQCLTGKQFDQYAEMMMQKWSAVVEGNKRDSRGMESFVLVLGSAILRGGRTQEQIKSLVSLLLSQAEEEKSHFVALKALHSLLNIIPAKSLSDLHFSVLQSLCNAAATKQAGRSFLRTRFNVNNVEALVSRWGHGHSALALLADSTQDVGLYDKYINTFNEKNVAEADEDAVARGVVEAIRDAEYFRYDALRSTPVIEKRLKTSTKHAALVALLDIFVSGTYSDYLKFAGGVSGAVIASSGLNAEDNAKKMRLLTLLTIFSSNGDSSKSTKVVVSYDTIASELQIEPSEVESYVIDAVNHGLCQVKMNQLARTVSVAMTVHREFTSQQWEKISSQMDLWKSSIGDLLDKLEQNKAKQISHVQQRSHRSASRK